MALTGDKGDTVRPGAARTRAEYVALLRRLKERSGLTYRQLEQRAAERGDVLARSTLADVLRRDALPRAELVTALVRACGAGREEEAEWLAARERLASTPESASAPGFDGGDEEGGASSPGPRRRGGPLRNAPLVAVAALGTVALLVIGASVLLSRDGDEPGADGAGPASGVTRLRPASAPELCLTEGNVRSRDGEYKTVAVQRPCAEAVPPTTSLVRSDDGRYRVQWDHPANGTGCLTLLGEGEFRNMLEPWDDCAVSGPAQLFRIERAEGAQGWRLRPEGDPTLCLGIRGAADEAGAAAIVEPCATAAGDDGPASRQRFLIGRK